MTNFLGQGKLSRRGLLQGGAALGAAALLGMPQGLQAQPRRGGMLRIAVVQGGVNDTLDPTTFNGGQHIFLGWCLRNNLTEIGADGALKPELAESWESDDAITWRFNLRRGVEFHNGKPFTAEDVIASLNLHRGEDSTSGAKALLDGVTEITSEGDHLVRVVLSGPNADFPFTLSDYHFNICPVMPDGTVDVSGTGTGGYILENFDPGVRTRLRRNPNYWKEGAAHFDEGEVLLINDPTAATNALVTGEVHAIESSEYRTLALLGRRPDIQVESVPGGFHGTFAMNSAIAPFNDNNLRLALKYGIDRQAIVDMVLKGHGVVANDHPISPMMPYHDAELEQRPYDPERARYHLQQAGHDELTLRLSVSDGLYVGAVDAVTMYREHAAPAGLDIEVLREPGDGYWSDVWMRKPFFAGSWGPRPVPDMILTSAYASNAAWNEGAFSNARFDELLVAARGELDQTRRASMYAEMQRLLSDEGGSIIPFFRNHVYGRSTNVAHSGQVGSDWPLDGHRAMERWWTA
ncbi:ABC transporter substrate-binding protein [Pararhodobacter oceanensis]|uniref:Peptide ABC transporter substrate-binding protein n=1 Tax=Pararhodobacter oceanensis TaxID=2172121 RepID=A0A2T8HRI1_9RHOB|nr:ABC transporter substrate-binding protein [Pararhodobacter oceanensis]PVH28034.1 peptide ABC transporter substrate-binding protein [Pararhodobacter oceanensis]